MPSSNVIETLSKVRSDEVFVIDVLIGKSTTSALRIPIENRHG